MAPPMTPHSRSRCAWSFVNRPPDRSAFYFDFEVAPVDDAIQIRVASHAITVPWRLRTTT